MTCKNQTQPRLRRGMMLYKSSPIQILFLPWITSGEYKWITLLWRRRQSGGSCNYGPQCYNKHNVEYASVVAACVCVYSDSQMTKLVNNRVLVEIIRPK